MTYKIVSQQDSVDGTKNTTIEFEYKDISRRVIVPHFRPRSQEEIVISIINRINSEIQAIDASEVSKSIQMEIDIEKEVSILSQIELNDETYSSYTSEELNQKLSLLSEEYNIIQEKILQGQSELSNNSIEYDLVIVELLKRS